jgi:hypothetical protein
MTYERDIQEALKLLVEGVEEAEEVTA